MFHFKQFSVLQDRCAMKIGMDGVLLGAWTPIENNPRSVLDIGSGTGILALILAQRTSTPQIDAIEIDENAYEQAVENFEASPWNDRLFCYHASLDEFVDEIDDEYDLIISNPPFYREDYKTTDKQRDLARFQDAMPFDELLRAADFFLSKNGVLSIIIPFKEETIFLKTATTYNLFPFKITRVKGNINSDTKRTLMAFSRKKNADIEISELTIEIARHQYTEEYSNLVKDLYLKL